MFANKSELRFALLLGILSVVSIVGCQSKRYDVQIPIVEEFHVAPDEQRYNQPPEQGYRKPPPKKEFKPGAGPPPGIGGMGGPGF